jgi:Transglutaminase-like superfamily
MRLYFQRDIPMWRVTYHLKPLQIPWAPYEMRSMSFQCDPPQFLREPNGFYSTSMTNVAAFTEERNMPPEDQLRSWVLIFYEEERKTDPDKFWKEIGKKDFATFKPLMKVDSLVKSTAAELTSGIDQPAAKIGALDNFCRVKVRNIHSGAFELTTDERKDVKENHVPSDTLKQKAGGGMDINLLFAALANAVGFDARVARVPDRGDIFFSRQRHSTYFLEKTCVAVSVNGQWVFYDPSSPYLEPGMLRWQEEGQPALISDPKEGFFAATQSSGAERSKRIHRGEFKLLEDGTLEGTVRYTYSGHVSRELKRDLAKQNPAQQEEDWKQALQARLSTAEISRFTTENGDDPVKPVVVSHSVSVPGYATRTASAFYCSPRSSNETTARALQRIVASGTSIFITAGRKMMKSQLNYRKAGSLIGPSFPTTRTLGKSVTTR